MLLDGSNFSSLLSENKSEINSKTRFVHNNQDSRPPNPVQGSCIMKGAWRLIDGIMLYNIEKDPRQEKNVFNENLDIVAELFKLNAVFTNEAKLNKQYNELPVHIVGNDAQN